MDKKTSDRVGVWGIVAIGAAVVCGYGFSVGSDFFTWQLPSGIMALATAWAFWPSGKGPQPRPR